MSRISKSHTGFRRTSASISRSLQDAAWAPLVADERPNILQILQGFPLCETRRRFYSMGHTKAQKMLLYLLEMILWLVFLNGKAQACTVFGRWT